MDIKRIAVVTAGLAVAGAVVGGVLGAAFSAAMLIAGEGLSALGHHGEYVVVAGAMGAGFGAVLGPAAAWLLMRNVPLWLAIGGTALGTLAGVAVTFLTSAPLLLFPLLGFGASALGMRLLVRRTSAAPAGELSA